MSSLHPVSGTAAEILELLREWDAAVDPVPLMIETSGSTGEPKRVLLSRAAMRASVDATHARLGGPGQWVLNVPPSYVAGVQVLFRSVRAGTEPVLVTDNDLDATRDEMTGPRTYVSLVPTQLHRLLDDGFQCRRLSRFDAVLVGGGPTRADDLRDAKQAGINVVRTYGMSETCGGCVYDGVPLDGVEIRIDDDRILLKGPMLFDGYEGEPERTQHAFEDGWLRTHDLGRIDDGVLTVLGREDDVIISGGVKVPAQAVERMLEPLGDVVVFGVPDAEWGERVVAAVAGPTALAAVRDLVEPRAWAPREIVEVEFAWLSNGKPDRAGIIKQARESM